LERANRTRVRVDATGDGDVDPDDRAGEHDKLNNIAPSEPELVPVKLEFVFATSIHNEQGEG
jgi:hypothetical protein